MNKLLKSLEVAGALMASAVSAQAGPTIPAQYQGEWCQTKGNPFLTSMAHLKPYLEEYPECKDHWNLLKITARTFEEWESYCKLTKVKGNTFAFACEFGDTEWKVNLQFSTSANGKRLHLWRQSYE